MSKLIFTTTLAVLGLGLLATDAEAFGRRQRRVTYVAPPVAVVAVAPVQGNAPAPIANAPAAQVQGYRAMSYQPQIQPQVQTQVQAPVYGGNRTGSMPFYAYPKTDPRRYQHN
jgi:hypothetical protein